MTEKQLSLIRQALFKVEMKEVEYMDSFPLIDMPHSVEYLEKIRSITNPDYKQKRKVFSKRRLIAAIIAAVLLMFATACAFRKPIMRFFERVYDDYIKLSIEEGIDEKISVIYTPSYIPSEYKKASHTVYQTAVSTVWQSGEDEIYLYQNPLNAENIYVGTKNGEQKIIYAGEQPVLCFLNESVNVFVWENGHYSFKLISPGTVELEEIEKMIGSISAGTEEN